MRHATRIRHAYSPLRRLALASGIGLGLPFACAIGAGAELGGVSALAGPWEISLQDTPRRCGMMLRAENAEPAGHVIALPAGCRRAMPVLADVGGWTLTNDRQLVLDDRGGKPILNFAAGENDHLFAQGPEGETYELVATGRQQLAQASPAPGGIQPAPRATGPALTTGPRTTPIPAQPAPVAAATPAASAALRQGATSQSAPQTAPSQLTTSSALTHYPGKVSDLAGRYVILRAGAEGGKDVGCMLTLDDRTRGPGGFRAFLAPACRDNGIVVFEPVGWRFDRGRLVLTAHKGHSAMFDYHADGSWWKDPKEGGKPLGVRHM
jgi:hypothetical protein